MPDPKAEARHQPQVEETANGIPLVNITAPSSGGVSRNEYETFNVPDKGAILNNSYTLSKTELAGYVQGNNNLAERPAKIIVNEVTGTGSTAMDGFLEVAGNRADVVIANPNGITVNGGGFIHTKKPSSPQENPSMTEKTICSASTSQEGTSLSKEKA